LVEMVGVLQLIYNIIDISIN
jgi:hypothetical protein